MLFASNLLIIQCILLMQAVLGPIKRSGMLAYRKPSLGNCVRLFPTHYVTFHAPEPSLQRACADSVRRLSPQAKIS
jgi:hypothetical protein